MMMMMIKMIVMMMRMRTMIMMMRMRRIVMEIAMIHFTAIDKVDKLKEG